MVLRVRTVGKARERVMRCRVREALFGTGVRTQSAEHPPRGREGERHHDDPERDAVADRCIEPEHGDQGREAQRNRDESQPSLRGSQLVCREGFCELAHRRVEHRPDEEDTSERIGHVEDVLRQSQRVGLDEPVDDVPDEHR